MTWRDDEDEAAGTTGEAKELSAALRDLRQDIGATARDLAAVQRGISGGLRRSLDAMVLDGARLSDALRGLGRSLADTVYATATRPVTDRLGGLMAQGLAGLLPFAGGAGFAGGRVMPFARGGVVSGPTPFPMRGATGLMGEAGPEAILPLARGPDGRLGVQAGGQAGATRPVSVTINVTTPDVAGFQRSQSQIAAAMGRALTLAQRNR